MDENLWAEWLKSELESQGISRNQLCRDTGISTATYNKWQHGTKVTFVKMLEVLDYLGYDCIFKRRKKYE